MNKFETVAKDCRSFFFTSLCYSILGYFSYLMNVIQEPCYGWNCKCGTMTLGFGSLFFVIFIIIAIVYGIKFFINFSKYVAIGSKIGFDIDKMNKYDDKINDLEYEKQMESYQNLRSLLKMKYQIKENKTD